MTGRAGGSRRPATKPRRAGMPRRRARAPGRNRALRGSTGTTVPRRSRPPSRRRAPRREAPPPPRGRCSGSSGSRAPEPGRGRRARGPGPAPTPATAPGAGADAGHVTGAGRPRDRAARIHVPATFAAAAPYQVTRGRVPGGGLLLRPGDLREARHEGRESNLVLFVVDASGSMAARARMGAVKGAVLSLLLDA